MKPTREPRASQLTTHAEVVSEIRSRAERMQQDDASAPRSNLVEWILTLPILCVAITFVVIVYWALGS